jgi:peptidoglycan hydrolase-like protein with peptidoglycan-binding domain
MSAQIAIRASVGSGGANSRNDVRVVQLLLNGWLRSSGKTLLVLDGIAGPLTCGAISSCQQALQLSVVDGRVDPGGPTLIALGKLCLEGLARGARSSPARAYISPQSGQPLPASDVLTVLWKLLAGSHEMPG